MRSGAFLAPLIPGPLPLTKKARATCPGLSSSCRRPPRLAKGGLPLRERQREVAARTLYDTPRKCPLNPCRLNRSLQYTI